MFIGPLWSIKWHFGDLLHVLALLGDMTGEFGIVIKCLQMFAGLMFAVCFDQAKFSDKSSPSPT